MEGVRLRSRPLHADRATRDGLMELAADLTFGRSDLCSPIVEEWSEDLVLVLDDHGVSWLRGPVERDPLQGRRGTSVLPRAAQIRLREIERLRMPFQRVAFAHELDPMGPVEPLLPALRTGRHTCTADVARTLVGDVPAHPWVSGILAMLDWAARGPRAALKAGPETARPALTRIIFGVTAPTSPLNGQLCLWFPITAWRW
jgi:hypothetical protein